MIKRFYVAMFATMLLLGGQPAFAAEPPPLSAYGALPAIQMVQISDSGERLAFVGVAGEDRRLVLQTVAGEMLATLNLGKTDIIDLIWAGEDDIVIVTAQVRTDPGGLKTRYYLAQAYSIPKKRVANLAARVPGAVGLIYTMPVIRMIDGKPYAYFAVPSADTPRMLLARVSVRDTVSTTPEWNTYDGLGWLIDDKGEAGARSRYDQSGGGWGAAIRRNVSGWPEVIRADAKLDRPGLVAFGPTGETIIVRVRGETGDRYIEVAADGSQKPALPDDHEYEGILIDPATSRIMGAVWRDEVERTVLFDPTAKTAWAKVLKTFAGHRVHLLSWTPDWRKVAVWVEGPTNAGTYFLVDLANRRADLIGERYPLITGDHVAEMKPYSYKAADGRKIEGYLTLPRGRTAKSLPLVVLPHGGPQARDELAFDWWAQAIASRGYAVLQPNFRGSTGYGLEHLEAGYGQWGRKMQTDLSDGVRALAAEGLIDPKRTCIAGWSYGGYAAMAGLTIEPGVYRCAVSMAGVSDLSRMLEWEAYTGGSQSETVRYWKRFMGAGGPSDPALTAISPAKQAARAEAPILLLHGKDDSVVPLEQSVIFADALKKAGKPVELITLEGEDHDLTKTATRLRMLEASMAFLLKHNPPD